MKTKNSKKKRKLIDFEKKYWKAIDSLRKVLTIARKYRESSRNGNQ